MLRTEEIPSLRVCEIVAAGVGKVKHAARSYGLVLGGVGIMLLAALGGALASPSGFGAHLLLAGPFLTVAGTRPVALGMNSILTLGDQRE
jgi:hypothetical protein